MRFWPPVPNTDIILLKSFEMPQVQASTSATLKHNGLGSTQRKQRDSGSAEHYERHHSVLQVWDGAGKLRV